MMPTLNRKLLEMSDQNETVMLNFSPWAVPHCSMDLSRVEWLQVQVSVWLVLVDMSTLAMEALVLEELVWVVSDSQELGLEVLELDTDM